MPPLTHIPPLSRDSLIVALQDIDRLPISATAKRALRDIVRAASNPDNDKIETIIKTLPEAQQEQIRRIFAEVYATQQANDRRARDAVLLLALLSLGGLIASYLLALDEQSLITAQLFNQNRRVWIQAIQDEIDFVGCNARAREASGNDLEVLRAFAVRDAESIVATYNRDAERQLTKLYKEFPTGSKEFFIESMKAWADKRAIWKALQIAATTDFNARAYAQARFREMNYAADAQYKFTGPPAVCKRCMTQFAAGYVDLAHTQQFATPIHPLCPHRWQITRKPKVDCNALWLG